MLINLPKTPRDRGRENTFSFFIKIEKRPSPHPHAT